METAIATQRYYSRVYWRSEQEKKEIGIRALKHGYQKPSGDPDYSSYMRDMAKHGILKKIMDNMIEEFVEKVNRKLNIKWRIKEHQ